MPYNTIVQYFDTEDGTEIEATTKKRLKEKINIKYDITKKTKKYEYNDRTGWTTITITAECRKKRQLQLFS